MKLAQIKEKIQLLLKNKPLIISILVGLLILFFIILNIVIKNNIYKTKDRSFFANTYSKIVNLPAIKINRDKISYIDYNKLYDYLYNFYKNQSNKDQTTVIPSNDSIKKEVINKLVKNAILEQLADKNKIEITDRDIYEEIKKLNTQTGSIDATTEIISNEYGMPIDDFKKYFIEPIILKNKLAVIISNDDVINKDKLSKINNIYDQIKSSNNAVTINKLGQKTDVFSALARQSSEDKTSAENDGSHALRNRLVHGLGGSEIEQRVPGVP